MALEPEIRLDVYSHNVKVSKFNQRGREALFEFCRPLTQFGVKPIGYNKFVRQMLRVFAAATADRSEFRFHRHQLEELLEHLKFYNYREGQIKIVHHDLYEPHAVEFEMESSFVPFDYQVPIIDYLVEDGAVKVVTLQTGKGKAQPLTSLIRIPEGWKRMGEIRVDDTVIAYDGSKTKVTGVFPQGETEVYRVTFTDGRSTECSPDHLWKVYSKGWRVVTTTELLQLISEGEVEVPLVTPEDRLGTYLPINPFDLGVRIGNGSYVNPIPTAYLEGSVNQRLGLLQGLVSVDGSYSTASLASAESVQYLVRSLGGIASIRAGARYELDVLLQQGPELRLKVESVEYVGRKETQCISIDHPEQLYVTDDWIVTHNTKLTLAALAQIGQRTMLVIKGMYVDKWIEDVKESFGLKPGELMVVRGGKNLKALIDLAIEGELDCKFIICTNKTIYNYLKSFEKFKDQDMGYGCRPEDLYSTLGVGVRVIDEAHQEFHTNFRQDLYSHVPKTINLSATLESDDAFMNSMYEIAYPRDLRFRGAAYDKYIAVKALMYGARDIRAIRYMGKRRNYSHVVFEQSIMKRKGLLAKYVDMLLEIIQVSFIRKREPGQKMLVFCSTIEFCTKLTEEIQRQHPTLKVSRYVSDDDYEDLLTSDISVSTIKSAGTAVDIENLRVTLMTDALNSRQANEQALGRTRRLKQWPDVTPEFIYLVCTDIQQHIRYHNNKREFFADKVLSQKEYNLGVRL